MARIVRIKRSPVVQGILETAEQEEVRCYICGDMLTEEDWGPECNGCLYDGFADDSDPFDGTLWDEIEQELDKYEEE